MPKTRTELHQGILNRIDERYVSEAAALQAESSNTPTLSTTATLDIYIDASLGEIYRSCLLLPCIGGLTGVSAQQVYALDTFTATIQPYPTLTGSRVWWVDGGTYNSTGLQYASQESVRRQQASYRSLTAGTPTHLYRVGDGAIGLYLAPSFTAGLTVGGYCVPPSITSHTVLSYMADAFVPIVEDRVAELVAEKQFSDTSLYGRIEPLRRRRIGLMMQAYNTIPRYTRDALGLLPPS